MGIKAAYLFIRAEPKNRKEYGPDTLSVDDFKNKAVSFYKLAAATVGKYQFIAKWALV